MPERSSKSKAKPTTAAKKPPALDFNQQAHRTMLIATGQLEAEPRPEKNPAAVALGKLGGAKGGPARAAALTPAKKKAIAKKAAAARWGTKKNG
ncbi:MAG TPA: hypothetical protein VGI10_14385 [Polyangiaceae bacterium]|jgi:hypothetical protein